MKSSKLKWLAIGTMAIAPVIGGVGLAGVAGATTGVHGSATLGAFSITITSWTFTVTSHFKATGQTTTTKHLAASIKGGVVPATHKVATVVVTVGASTTKCTVTIPGTVNFTGGSGSWTATKSVASGDYVGNCKTSPTGNGVIDLTP